MTIKLKLFFMFIMLPPLLYGQNKLVEESIIYSSDISSYKKKIEKTIFFDTETNLPVFELILDTARSSKMYTSYYFRKRLREVSTEISYIGGNESLRKYQDSLYWENYNGDEQNASCLYTILFDRKLKIREIKIVKRAGYNNSKYNYDKLIKKIRGRKINCVMRRFFPSSSVGDRPAPRGCTSTPDERKVTTI